MNQKERAAVIEEFAKPSKAPKILLISLKVRRGSASPSWPTCRALIESLRCQAGGTGLNLTMANRKFWRRIGNCFQLNLMMMWQFPGLVKMSS
jgi:hypothetical protein